MNCTKCGTELPDGAAKCENCGAAIGKAALTYDYKTIEANQQTAPEIVDCYEALGWEFAAQRDALSNISLNFKRNRRIKNRDQLNRLQVKLDDSINCIGVYEKRKTQKATMFSIIIGIIGTLVFGSGLCLCMPDVFKPEPELWMYVVGVSLAAIGTGLCVAAYRVYKKIRAKSTVTMNTLIDKKRDEISHICEDAQRLLA